MKTTLRKLALIVGILGGLALGTASYALNSSGADMFVNCKYGQCQAIAKSTGQQCKHCVSNPGDLYCWQHNK